jgi:HSP20 family protein
MDAIIVRREPTETLTPIPTFIDQLWDDWTGDYEESRNMMPIDMYQVKDDLVIRAELPGFRKEEVDVSVEGDELTIKGERKQEELPEGSKSYLCERCYGDYRRTVTLPFEVEVGKISATFENGILEIKLPMREEAKPKHIAVTVK